MPHGELSSLHPATLQDRGVCLPCTTPTLVGARVRLSDREGLELVAPRASGVRGAYVTPLRSVGELCRPTVHDTRLLARIGTLRTVTPATVREAAWQAASEGFAGRRARAAAAAAMAAAHEARLLSHYHLLAALVRHTEAPLPGPLRPARIEALARRAITRLAGELGRDAEAVGAALGALAVLYAPLGLGGRTGTARVPVLAGMIQALRKDLSAVTAEDAATVKQMAEFTLACATVTLREARGAADMVPELLKAWLADPAGMAAWISRADWLADGWGWLCHHWMLAEGPSRHGALEDMAAILPPVPREAMRWVGAAAAPPRAGGRIAAAKDGPDAVLRNETLLALAA